MLSYAVPDRAGHETHSLTRDIFPISAVIQTMSRHISMSSVAVDYGLVPTSNLEIGDVHPYA